MRILIVSSLYPPHVQGGAEICAYNLATWLARNGHEVAVLTTSPTKQAELFGEMVEGVRLWRIFMPRAYTAFVGQTAPGWKKPFWHLQDVLDPRNEKIIERVLDVFQPDFVNVHHIQGIGYNGLKVFGVRDLPVVYTLHDIGLACVKMAMFSKGKECDELCTTCAITAKLKRSYLTSIRRIGFISPSQANLDRLLALQPIEPYPRARIPNAIRYPKPTVERSPSDRLRLLYVGRLDETKGVDVLLDAVEPLADTHDFSLKVVGTGPAEAALRARYGHHSWLTFTGQVPLQEATNSMAAADMLFIPSIWLENSPGVVIQALSVGLPVMGSDKGGIPELVTHGENGVLVPPGDVEAWRTAIRSILENPTFLEQYRENAERRATEFDQDHLANRMVAFFEEVMAFPGA
jgi:glycosyltransferase involved in cell wall biosynthesis